MKEVKENGVTNSKCIIRKVTLMFYWYCIRVYPRSTDVLFFY